MSNLPLVTESEDDFSVVFGTDTNDISAQTFITSMLSLSTALTEINHGLDTGQELDIRIKATSPGSFIVDLHLMVDVVHHIKNLLTVDNGKTAAILIGAFNATLNIAKNLKKGKPQSVTITNNNVTINTSNQTIEVPAEVWRVYSERTIVQDSVYKLLETVAEDDTITSLSVRDHKGEETFRADKSELQSIAAPVVTAGETSHKRLIEEIDARVIVIKPSFIRSTKWRLDYLGMHIGAEIQDEVFLTKIDNGEEGFYIGDVLNVHLQIIKVWSEIHRTHIAKNYIVTNVMSHEKSAAMNQMTIPNLSDGGDEEF